MAKGSGNHKIDIPFLKPIDLSAANKSTKLLTVNPGYSGQSLQMDTIQRIQKLHNIITENGLRTYIQADGNINPNTIPLVTQAGAKILTGGTSGLFLNNKSIDAALKEMIDAAS
jgi:ribulose-phosphate 3-epimerase